MSSKRLLYIFTFILIGIVALSSCKKDKVPVVVPDNEPTVFPTMVTPEITKEPKSEDAYFAGYSEEEILNHSFELAEQMAKGKFTETALQFSEAVKAKLDEESLKIVWDSTVLLIGSYKGIEKEIYQQELSGEYAVCLVVLRYKSNGLSIKFVYNEVFEIDGLFLDYYSFEEKEEQEEKDLPDDREISILLESPEYPIEGILTLPDNAENPPVVILVQGSGQSDMDETIGLAGNKPFRDIAIGLADNGIATIRINKRFYVHPELAEITSTIYDEVLDDVREAVRFALSDGRVDSERIFVAGHSLGGMLSPKIADMNQEVKGIISLAGSPRRLEDIIYDQNKDAIMQMMLYSEEELNDILTGVAEMVSQVKNLSEENLDEPILGASGYYWKSLNDIDTISLAKGLNIPMLILQGAEDFQIYADVDYVLWQDILSEKENASFRLYEDLNHLFMVTSGLRNIGDYDIKANVSQDVIDDIASWILTGKLLEKSVKRNSKALKDTA